MVCVPGDTDKKKKSDRGEKSLQRMDKVLAEVMGRETAREGGTRAVPSGEGAFRQTRGMGK